jgi:hypothetical protein
MVGGAAETTPLGQIVIATEGPRVALATYNHETGQVTVTFEDPVGLDLKSLSNPAFFLARSGKKSGVLTIANLQRSSNQVTFTVSTSRGRKHPATISLDIVSGGVRDVAGNALDGEFHGTFPSGNGQPGGDFVTPLPLPRHKHAKTGNPAGKTRA